MAVTHPDLAWDFHPTINGDLSPRDVTAGTQRKLWWLCSTCESEWAAVRHSGRHGCPACSGHAVHSDGRNSMAATHPHLAKEIHPTRNGDLTPGDVLAGTGKKLWWLCSTCEHEWSAAGSWRVAGNGCGACANQALHIDGRNSLATVNPEVASEFHPENNGETTPENIVAGSEKKVWWLCETCEHEWRITPGNRTGGRKSGCPACSNKALHIRGLNSLAVTHPDLAAEFHPEKNEELTPRDIIAGTHKKLWWLCSTCGHEWDSAGGWRIQGNGCPACAPTGFQAGLPGYYYVHGIINVETQDLLFYKGGISGNWIKRLEQLMRGLPPGLEIQNIETIWFEIGQSAMELESRLKAVHEIRAPKREFGGGDELFLVNPLDFARENGWV